ncbi:MAG TPA: MATE family efflux transporter [Chthoniobacter sp.]|jgi:O-antigen/teichoic acid export membrane protein
MNVKGTLWRTSASSYLRTIVRLILGLVTFRMLYSGLSKSDFGFWSLLWSVFGYGVLVDFGLGFAAQKRVAELAVSEDWEELSRVLSTIITFFLGVGAIVLLLGWFGADALLGTFKIAPGDEHHYRGVFLIFLGGLAVGFPLGIFPEILRGLQRISTVNHIITIGVVVNAALLAAALHFGWGLHVILLIALATTIGPDLACAIVARALLPQVRISPRLFQWGKVRQTMQFSIWAYLITATNIVLGKTDQLVIGTTLAVSAVAIYVTGSKVSDIFSMFTRQLQEALSPAAAHLRAKGHHDALRELLVEGTRLSVMIAAPLYLLCAFYMAELMKLLTGEAQPNPDGYWTGQVLLAWYFTSIMTHNVSKRIFVMCGHERRLMWLGLAETIGNLVCSIGLILVFKKVVCVAVGSIIPSLVIGWGFMWPWCARDAGLSPWQLARAVLLPTFFGCLPMAAALCTLRFLPWHHGTLNFGVVAIESTLAIAIAFAGFWKCVLTETERAKIAGYWVRIHPRRRLA